MAHILDHAKVTDTLHTVVSVITAGMRQVQHYMNGLDLLIVG